MAIDECAHCGVIIGKALRARAVRSGVDDTTERVASETVDLLTTAADAEAKQEFYVRAFAIPAALTLASAVVATMPFAARVVSMWVHEGGHALGAWLAGYLAFPGPWVTPMASERARVVTLLVIASLAVGGYASWQRSRWLWLAASSAGLTLAVVCGFGLDHDQAQQLIVFSGDAGLFVLGTALMLTVYSRQEHAVRREGLRWAFVVIGALAFMDARTHWTGSAGDIPFGEDDRGLSDPSVLLEHYGWGVSQLQDRYASVATACTATLGAAYFAGLLQALFWPARPSSAAEDNATPRPER